MPVNSLQQEIASALMSLGAHGGKAWFAIGSLGALFLTILAILPLLPSGTQTWLGRSRLTRGVASDAFFIAAILAVIAVLRFPGLSQLQLNPDESCLLLGARTLMHDARYWISIEGQSLGPVSTFAVALPGALGFPIDFTSIKVLAILTWCVASVAMFLGFRRLYSAALARVFVLPFVLTAAAFTYFDYVAFNGEHMPILLFALVFWLHANLLRDPATVQPVRCFLIGAFLALVPLAKSQTGPLAFAWGAMACILALWNQPRRILHLVAGSAAVVLLLAAYLFASGAFHDFWQAYILNNLLYAAVGWNATQEETTLLANTLRAPSYFLKPPDSRGFFLFGAIVAGAGAAGAVFSKAIRSRLKSPDVVLSLVLCGAAAFCVILPKNNWTHYLLLLFIPISMLTASVLAAVFGSLEEMAAGTGVSSQKPEPSRRVSGRLALGMAVAIFGGFLPAEYAMKRGNPAIREAAENFAKGNTPGPVTAGILRHARPGEPVAHWGVLFSELCEAGVSMGTRDAQIERALYPSRQQQYYLDRWVSDVYTRRARVLLDSGTGKLFARFRLDHFPAQREKVLARYKLAEDVEGFHIYVLKE
jgi:hypothetical protein